MLKRSRKKAGLDEEPDFVKVDGNRLPKWDYPSEAIVKGDTKEACICAASILAKVTRDSRMYELHSVYPEYSFDKHKGYATRLHTQKLKEHGPLPQHRLSYKPVRETIRGL